MPSAAKDSRARLLVYALLSHLLLLAHQAAYFGFTAPEAQSAAAWVNTYLAGGELGLEPGTAPAGLLSALLIVVVQLSGLDVELGLTLINVLAAHMLRLGLLLGRHEETAPEFLGLGRVLSTHGFDGRVEDLGARALGTCALLLVGHALLETGQPRVEV